MKVEETYIAENGDIIYFMENGKIYIKKHYINKPYIISDDELKQDYPNIFNEYEKFILWEVSQKLG